MKTSVMVNVFSENEHQFLIQAKHSQKRSFRKDWGMAMEQVRAKFPHDWHVLDIENLVKKTGWKLSRPKMVEVAY